LTIRHCNLDYTLYILAKFKSVDWGAYQPLLEHRDLLSKSRIYI